MTCELCGQGVLIERYHVGAIHGRLCSVCMQGAASALAAWTLRRMHEVEHEAAQRARHAREERDVAALTGSVVDELLPATTLRAARERCA